MLIFQGVVLGLSPTKSTMNFWDPELTPTVGHDRHDQGLEETGNTDWSIPGGSLESNNQVGNETLKKHPKN